MWASSPIDRPSARFVVAELEQIGLSWDPSGQQFSRVAKAANARGVELACLLATSTAQHRAQVIVEKEVASSSTLSAAAGLETRVYTDSAEDIVEGAPASGGIELDNRVLSVSVEDAHPLLESGLNSLSGGVVLPLADAEAPLLAPAGGSKPTEIIRGRDALRPSVDNIVDSVDCSTSQDEPELQERDNLFGEVGSITVADLNSSLVPMIFSHIFDAVVSTSEREFVTEQRSELADLEGRGLHSFTFRLNLSASCGIGVASRGCVARVKGVCRGGV